jgi:hypothetical protein
VAKLILEISTVARVERGRPDGRERVGLLLKRWLGETGELFRNPVVKSVAAGDTYHMYFGRPLVCFNAMHLSNELSLIPNNATAVTLHITDLVTLIDHTAATAVFEFVDNFKRTGRGIAPHRRSHCFFPSSLSINNWTYPLFPYPFVVAE